MTNNKLAAKCLIEAANILSRKLSTDDIKRKSIRRMLARCADDRDKQKFKEELNSEIKTYTPEIDVDKLVDGNFPKNITSNKVQTTKRFKLLGELAKLDRNNPDNKDKIKEITTQIQNLNK